MNITMVPFHDYKKWLKEGFRTRDAHLCQHLEKNEEIDKILVINRPVSLAELLVRRNGWKTKNGQIAYSDKNVSLSKITDKVWCLDFFLHDFIRVALQDKSWWYTAFQYPRIQEEINNAISYLKMEDNILLLENPMAIGVAQGIKNTAFVFDAIDNWLYHPQMGDKKLIKKNYQYIDRNADFIVTVSKALMGLFPNNKNVYWIPNGVDVEYFESAIKKHRNSKKRVVGYVGKVQDRVDFDLVENCLKTFPHIQFKIIGPVYAQKRRVDTLKRKYNNILFTGDIHYDLLPQHMRDLDITIIPHKVDKFTDSMNPLKLYEYLAAGKPVVSTNIAGIDEISRFVYVAKNDKEFIQGISYYLKEIEEGHISSEEIISSIPNECKWNNRIKDLMNLFRGVLCNKL